MVVFLFSNLKYARCFGRTSNIVKGFISKKCYRSTLFIPGSKANETFAYVSPYLDFDKRLQDVAKLENELLLRGFDVDVSELKKTWQFYKSIDADKCVLEKKEEGIYNRINKLNKKKTRTENEDSELNNLRLLAKAIKPNVRSAKEAAWELESTVVDRVLQLPNSLDAKTPPAEPEILKCVKEIPRLSDDELKSHLDIGKYLGLIEYRNPLQCYLCNDAALFELGILNMASKVLNEENMVRIAGADFARSVIVEGCGINHEDPAFSFILKDSHADKYKGPSRMHLVGAASLFSFVAMHTKQLINPKSLPIKYFATGRQYTPFPDSAVPFGLFTICQSSAAQIFSIVKGDDGEENQHFDEILNAVEKVYQHIDCHYRVVLRPANELQQWESKRVSFEMWSSHSKQYVEVGNLSTSGDYLSKRLLVAYQTSSGRGFPSIISGTILSVPRILACLLEQNPKNFILPEKIAAGV